MGYLKRQHGFTLIEIIVTAAILGIIGAVAVGIIGNQSRAFVTVFNRSVLTSDVQKAINIVRNDIRNLSRDGVTVMEPGNLSFTDDEGNEVEYLYEAYTLKRNDNVIATNLQAPPFTYLDEAKAVTVLPESLSFVKVTLIAARENDTVKIEEEIYVRN